MHTSRIPFVCQTDMPHEGAPPSPLAGEGGPTKSGRMRGRAARRVAFGIAGVCRFILYELPRNVDILTSAPCGAPSSGRLRRPPSPARGEGARRRRFGLPVAAPSESGDGRFASAKRLAGSLPRRPGAGACGNSTKRASARQGGSTTTSWRLWIEGYRGLEPQRLDNCSDEPPQLTDRERHCKLGERFCLRANDAGASLPERQGAAAKAAEIGKGIG